MLCSMTFLLFKLEQYGMRGVALDWIRRYLQQRQQYVHVKNISCDKLMLRRGVPQGSILGHLNSLICINYATMIPESRKIIMHAEDTNILFRSKFKELLEDNVNVCLVTLSEWLERNRLRLNVNKTNYIILRPISKCRKTIADCEIR